MKKRVIGIFVCSLLLANILYAKEMTTQNSSKTEQTKTLAEAYEMLEVMHMEKTYSKMLKQILYSQSTVLPKELRGDKVKMQKYNETVLNFLNKYIGWDIIKEDMAKLYTKYYTFSELNDIKNFYLTSTGQKSLDIMPQVMSESMQLTQSKLLPHMEELRSEITKIITKK